MKKILYVGNDLKHKSINTTVMRTLGPALEKEGYTVYYTSPKKNKIFRLLDMVFSVLRYGKRVDVVFIDTYSTLNFYYALTVSWLSNFFNLPYVPILHGGNLITRIKSSPILAHRIFDNAFQNVSPSRYLYEEFKANGYNNVIHIPNFINIKDYPLTEKSYEQPKLLWVRSLADIYNPKQAILVADKLQKKNIKLKLCMVGPDPRDKMEDLKLMASEKRVEAKFTGKLAREEWIELSKDYNLFINTANVDNMPVSVIEAMALGFPVVSTNVGGIPFFIEQNKNGIMVQPNNIDAMTDAIMALWRDKEKLKDISQNARKTAATFDWSEVKHLWIALLNRDNDVKQP